jgi:hypothetical protein
LAQAIERYSKTLSLYKHLGHRFESNVVEELEELAACHDQLGELEETASFRTRVKQLHEELQKDDEESTAAQ